MPARFHVDMPLASGASLSLTDAAARHVQVLRMQPGERITLFNGQGAAEGEFDATITRMGRSDVDVNIGTFTSTARESGLAIHLVVAMPANDRMDWLVEKATQLGVTSIQPVMSERSVLRLKAERADKKVAHWQGVATAASEQCGRNRLPLIHEVCTLADWFKKSTTASFADAGSRLLLSLQHGSQPLRQAVGSSTTLTFLNGPEGGLSPAEEAAALACGFRPVTLGPRVLRAETAPLACLALLNTDQTQPG